MGLDIRAYEPRVVVDPIQAVKLTKYNMHDVAQWAKGRVYEETANFEDINDMDREPEQYLSIVSKHGVRKAKPGDYIVKKDDEFQPYPADKFERSWRRVPLRVESH